MKPLYFCLPAAAVALASAQPAAAQGIVLQRNQAVQAPAAQLDASTLQRLGTIQTSYDRRIAAAFDRNPALRDRMKAALEAIGAERDSVRKRQMIASYQQTYGTQYQQVLQAGGVDLSAMAREMKAAAPAMNFSVSNRMAIAARPVASLGTAGTRVQALSTSSSTGLRTLGSPAPSPTERRERLALRDFESDRNGSCGNFSGNEATRNTDGFVAATNSAVLAGCSAGILLAREFTVPAGEVGELSVRGVIEAEAYALGILGFSQSSASGDIILVNLASNGRHIDIPDFPSAGVDTRTLAPLLSSTSSFDDKDLGLRTVTLPAGNYRLVLRGSSNSFAAGVVAGTNAVSRVKEFSATITYRPAT